MTRLDPYSASLREEQKAILNGLLGLIYDNYDTTRRIESTVNSIYRITIALLVIVVLLVIGIIVFVCVLGCRKYQSESRRYPREEHRGAIFEDTTGARNGCLVQLQLHIVPVRRLPLDVVMFHSSLFTVIIFDC
ncbi:hypothetical protein V3C99_002784 [Haemonchus contortus]